MAALEARGNPEAIQAAIDRLSGHTIIAGFGIPGRAAANLCLSRKRPFCVIEMNPDTVNRCAIAGLLILQGNAEQEATLLKAGILRTSLLALAMPNEPAVLTAIDVARRLNPAVRILARCRYVSTALEAMRRGADEVLSEEQVIAQEFSRLMSDMVPSNVGAGTSE